MSGQTLMMQREEIKKSLNRSMEKLHQNGTNHAEKKREYRRILAQTILMLKSKGMPVSVIKEVAKGQEDVAQAECDAQIAEVLYISSRENIMIQKKLLDSIEEDIKREWGRSG